MCAYSPGGVTSLKQVIHQMALEVQSSTSLFQSQSRVTVGSLLYSFEDMGKHYDPKCLLVDLV